MILVLCTRYVLVISTKKRTCTAPTVLLLVHLSRFRIHIISYIYIYTYQIPSTKCPLSCMAYIVQGCRKSGCYAGCGCNFPECVSWESYETSLSIFRIPKLLSADEKKTDHLYPSSNKRNEQPHTVIVRSRPWCPRRYQSVC